MEIWITATELRAARRQLSPSVEEAKLNDYIEEAQLKDVRPLLGEKFYAAIDAVRVAEGSTYDELLESTTYTHDGDAFRNPGLKDVIARFAYARYKRYGHVEDTLFGSVVKQNQESRETSKAEKEAEYHENRITAGEQWNSVKAYLNRKSTTYPLWSNNNAPRIRMSKISKR